MKEVAARHDATPGQVALAWLHAQGDDVFPIPVCYCVRLAFVFVFLEHIKITDSQSLLCCAASRWI